MQIEGITVDPLGLDGRPLDRHWLGHEINGQSCTRRPGRAMNPLGGCSAHVAFGSPCGLVVHGPR